MRGRYPVTSPDFFFILYRLKGGWDACGGIMCIENLLWDGANHKSFKEANMVLRCVICLFKFIYLKNKKVQ